MTEGISPTDRHRVSPIVALRADLATVRETPGHAGEAAKG